MVGKFLLIALVSVSLVQVRGDELQAAIEKGLNSAKNIYENGRKGIDAAIAEVANKAKLIDTKTEQYIQKAVNIQEGARQGLRKVAAVMEEKAKDCKDPQSALDCIKKNEDNANKQIETLTNKFKTDMERLRAVKQENIKTDSKPLDGMQDALKVRYNRAVKDIKNCKNPQAVETAVNSFNTWVESNSAVIKRVESQVATILNNFERDAKNYSINTNRQVNRIKSTAMTAIKGCVNSKE